MPGMALDVCMNESVIKAFVEMYNRKFDSSLFFTGSKRDDYRNIVDGKSEMRKKCKREKEFDPNTEIMSGAHMTGISVTTNLLSPNCLFSFVLLEVVTHYQHIFVMLASALQERGADSEAPIHRYRRREMDSSLLSWDRISITGEGSGRELQIDALDKKLRLRHMSQGCEQ